MRRCGSPWRHSPRPAATAGAMGTSAPRVTYFERDFDFDEHAAEVEATWDPAVGGGPAPAPSVRLVRAERAVAPRATTRGRRWSAATPSPSSDELTTARQSARWDEFHEHHDAGDFFKERRYLLAEFPAAGGGRPDHHPRNGCGSGSSCVPILRSNPRARVLACDFSPAAVRCTARAAARLDLADRLAAFTCDPARDDLAAAASAAAAAGFPADEPIRAACLVFVLSAVPPDALPAFLDSVRRALPPRWSCIFSRLRRVRSSHAQVRTLGSARKSRVREGRTDPRSLFPRRGNPRRVRERGVRGGDRSGRRGTGAVLLRAQRKQEEGDQDATRVRARRLQKIARAERSRRSFRGEGADETSTRKKGTKIGGAARRGSSRG